MAGPIKISVLADVGQATKSVTQFSNTVDSETKRVVTTLGDSKISGGFGKLQEGFDVADTRAMGFADTITGVQDTMTAFQGFMGQGEAASKSFGDKLLMLGQGTSDLASGFANFIVPMAAAASAMNGLSLASAKAAVSTVAQKVAMAAGAVATGAMTAAQWLLNAALSANPIGIIILAIVALVAAIVLAYKNSETFRAIVQAVWAAIQAAISAVVDWFKAVIPSLWAAAQAVWSAIQTAASTVWNAIKAVINVVILAVTAYINAYRTVVVAVWNAISTAASAVWNAIKAVVAAVVAAITAQFNAVRATAQAVWSAVSSAASTAWNSVKATVSSVVNAVTTTLTGLVNKVKSAFSGAASLLVNVGRDIVNGLVNGISGAWGWVTSKINSLVSAIPGPVRKLLGIGSPSKVFAEIGMWTGRGLAEGIDGQQARVRKAAEALVSIPQQASAQLDSNARIDVAGISRAQQAQQSAAPLVIDSAGSRLDDLLLEVLRNAVRARGGNVQTVLGRA